VKCPLQTYLSHPITSSTLCTTPELVQDEKGFNFLYNARKRGGFTWPHWVNIDVSLKGKGVFYRPSFPIPKIIDTPDLSVSSHLNSLKGEKDFLWCLNLPRGYISSSPGCTEDF